MKVISILIAVVALPFMALGQAPDQQAAGKDQTNETQEKAPAKKKKARQGHEMTNPKQDRQDTSATMHDRTKAEGRRGEATMSERTKPQGRTTEATRAETGSRANRTHTKTVNKEQFKSSHREVFTLGRHDKQFFVQRFGANHFRLFGNTYFVFVDDCWVAVDVAGFTFVERTICPGDPDYVVIY